MTNLTQELPLGLGMALAKNPKAMQQFGLMTASQQQELITKTHTINSKEEMQALVSSIAL
ncbi:MAG: hypothetical protein VB106_10330 [Clostridiaceae bacterium]|nr:hypothetical protein [Clostridiaceae bacterium]